LNHLSKSGEKLLSMTVLSGVETIDTPFANATLDAADRIARVFETAIEEGALSEAEVFDENYVPIPGTNPEQFTTKFTAHCEKHFPAIQEPLLDLDPSVVFGACIDRNGYLPMHNLKFAHEQTDDIEWNTANCRTKRFFDDAVAVAANANTERLLLQCYRRDMGAGQFVMMKDISTRIMVRGRHWGTFRIGYKV